jgi:hypothetical protein
MRTVSLHSAFGIAAAVMLWGMVAEGSSPSAQGAPSQLRTPLAQVLGIGLGMPEDRIHRTLARIGRRAEMSGEQENEEEGEGLERELWMLDDRRYGSVLVVFDARKRVRALQAYLRPGGRGLRYQEIGDLSQARRMGYTIWQWDVPGGAGKPGRRVVARGTDSTYVGSVAITTLDDQADPPRRADF